MKRKILIVDDSQAILGVTETYLTKNGYDVKTATNGEEAFDIIRRTPYPVVFTDIKMPKMNGIELIEKIKNTYPMIRVIIGTGYVDFKYGLTAFTNGAETIIFKPYNYPKLLEIVENCFKFLDDWELKLKELQEMKGEKEPNPEGTETVLYADDDEKVKNFSKFNLEKQGYTFLSVSNGAEGLAMMDKAKDIDLIMTSAKLSDMNGMELYKVYKKINPKIRVLYIVSYKEEIIFEDDVLHEDDAYIYSPFTQKILTKAVRKTLDE